MSHAILSASAAHRWLACTPSARLEQSFEDRSSGSAKEGTLAHAIAELKVKNMFIDPMPKRSYNKKLKDLQSQEEYAKEMDRHTDDYAEYVKEIVLSYPSKPQILVEQRVDFSRIVPEGFGTADCLIFAGEDLHIVDMKYGRNVPVSPEGNPQLRLYALGAIEEYGLIFDIKNVYMRIFQPRNEDGGGKAFMTVEDLTLWAAEIAEKVAAAYAGEGDQVTGDHCTFCKAKPLCRAYANRSKELAKLDFKMPPLLSGAEVGEILQEAKDIAAWAKSLEDWALAEVLSGGEVPGWKAVHGRSSREWSDFEEAFGALIAGGIDESILYERKPLTLAQVEKEIGKKEFNDLVGEFVVKGPGKPTLVTTDDKREAIKREDAREDFKDE